MNVLLTGGSGRLGSELLPLLAAAGVRCVAPESDVVDVAEPGSLLAAARRVDPDVLVHAAAYTDVAGAERDRETCWRVNVTGTRYAAAAADAVGAKLVHVSTDYVFWGDSGGYTEDDTPGPVRNYYALTKLVAEEAARGAGSHLIVRTSFRPRAWPYPEAYTDLFTSQDYVDVLAPDLAMLVREAGRIAVPVIHVATERKSVFELARRRAPDVRPASKDGASVALPDDVSLDVGLWRTLKASLSGVATP